MNVFLTFTIIKLLVFHSYLVSIQFASVKILFIHLVLIPHFLIHLSGFYLSVCLFLFLVAVPVASFTYLAE